MAVAAVAAKLARAARDAIAPVSFAEKIPRYLMLDGVRGLAAVAVLFWHYQHFFLASNLRSAADRAALEPLHAIFAPLYEHGDLAVSLFWTISGFVFAGVYGGATTTSRNFVVNRIARLYPLHLLTLLLVALLQFLAVRRFGGTLIYESNTVQQFILQLFFASAWPGRLIQSFNGPVWSVSIEVLIYAVFWATHRRLLSHGAIKPLLMSLGFMLLIALWRPHRLFECGALFFLGCATFAVHRALADRRTMALLLAIVIGVGGVLLQRWSAVGARGVMAGFVLAIATLDISAFPKPRRLLSVIGDSTYGIYLWHVPIQLTIFLLASSFGQVAALARSPLWLAAFLASVLAIARLSFLLFERPMRERIRRIGEARGRDAPIAAP